MFGKSRRMIGVHLSASNIRMALFSGSPDAFCLENCAVEAWESSGSEPPLAAVAACYAKLGTDCKALNLALPANKVFIEENLRLPAMSPKQPPQQYFIQTAAKIGDGGMVDFDWQQTAAAEDGEERWLWAAAKSSEVAAFAEPFERAGLSVVNADVDVFALYNAYVLARRYGFGNTDAAVLVNYENDALRAVVCGGGGLLGHYAQSRQMPATDFQAVYEDKGQAAVREIERVLPLLLAEQNADETAELILSGSLPEDDGIWTAQLAASSGMAVRILKLPELLGFTGEAGAEFDLACALAWRGLADADD